MSFLNLKAKHLNNICQYLGCISDTAKPLVSMKQSSFSGVKFLLLFVLLFFTSAPGFAETPSSSTEIKRTLETGIELTIRNDFAGAATVFEALIRQYPDNPCGYFYLGATYQAEMLDCENYALLDTFRVLMDKTIVLAKAQQKVNKNDPWALFFEGSAYLYRSFMDSKRSKLWGAYRNAVKGVDRLEKALEMDSTFYDAYLGIGSYKYWKSVKAKSLTWLPFLSDEREKGIKMVHQAIEHGYFTRYVGRDQLAWILLSKGDLADALAQAEANYQLFPESRFFRWTLIEIVYKNGQWDRALELYEDMLQTVREIPGNNHHNEVDCLIRMAEIHFAAEAYQPALACANEILALDLQKDVRERNKKKLKRAREIVRESEKKTMFLQNSNGAK